MPSASLKLDGTAVSFEILFRVNFNRSSKAGIVSRDGCKTLKKYPWPGLQMTFFL